MKRRISFFLGAIAEVAPLGAAPQPFVEMRPTFIQNRGIVSVKEFCFGPGPVIRWRAANI
jgi:hypothetical protein